MMTFTTTKFKQAFLGKKLIVFDLDGTLTESKSAMDAEMAHLLCALLGKNPLAVIGGGKYKLFKEQLLAKLHCPEERFKNLYLFPTTATSFYRYCRSRWLRVYVHNLTLNQRRRIFRAFERAFKELKYNPPQKVYGSVIEDRGTQVTFSALGQDIVAILGDKGVQLKKEWKRKYTPLKMKLARLVQKYLPDLEVRTAGYTSIDVTKKGIDKAYGVRQIEKNLNIPIKDMLFVGDSLHPGGNDYAAKRTGIQCLPVSGPKETKKLVKFLLKSC